MDQVSLQKQKVACPEGALALWFLVNFSTLLKVEALFLFYESSINIEEFYFHHFFTIFIFGKNWKNKIYQVAYFVRVLNAICWATSLLPNRRLIHKALMFSS